jgi:hypothetical protein
MFATSGFLIVVSMITSSRLGLSDLILVFTLAGLIFGLCLYVLNLPFMILGFVNPFFRERFCACLRLQSIPTTAGHTDAGRLNERNSNPGTSEDGSST